jgi:hypothetical protein
MSHAKNNVWMSLRELQKAYIMSCHGIQLLGPVKFEFKKSGRFVMRSFFDKVSRPIDH